MISKVVMIICHDNIALQISYTHDFKSCQSLDKNLQDQQSQKVFKLFLTFLPFSFNPWYYYSGPCILRPLLQAEKYGL